MAPPPWVAGVLAGVLLAIAGYCATRLAAARWWRRSTDHGVDAMHAVMGVAMAGMLVPRLNPLQARAWAALFGAGAVWFGWQVIRDRRRRAAGARVFAPHGPGGHHGAHVLSCSAMVCMLLATPDLAAPMPVARGPMPVVALVLAVAVAISVVVSTDRIPALGPARAAPAPVPPAGAASGPAPATGGTARSHGPAAQPGDAPLPLLCPRVASCCQIVMGVAMAYMLILMI